MPNTSDQTLCQLDALNNWLGDVYGEETHFSTLLIDAGFNNAEIEQINRVHLSEFLQMVLSLLDSYPDLSNEGLNRLMVQHYGLIDGRPQNFYIMSASLGVGGERVRQLVNKRLSLYRDPTRQAKLRDDFAAIGRRLLNTESLSKK